MTWRHGLAVVGRGAYVIFVLWALTRIPSRTNYELVAPSCDLWPAGEDWRGSLTNWPHMILFGLFFFITWLQFRGRPSVRLGAAAAVTLVFSAVIELEQGATRTGNCEIHDLLPNLIGVSMVAAVLLLARAIRPAPSGQ